MRPEAPEILLLPQLIQLLDLPRAEFERHSPEVITKPLLLTTGRDRHDILIHTPTQQHLSLRNSILLRQRANVAVDGARRGFRDRRQRTVRRGRDAVLLVARQQVLALQVRVELDLVDGGRDFRRLHYRLDVFGQEVGDADALRQPGFADRFHLCPGFLQSGRAAVEDPGRVDQVQIYVVEAEV